MMIKAEQFSPVTVGPTQTVCPHCGHKGTFEVIGQDLFLGTQYICGQRRCPALKCHGHLFIILNRANELIFQYPPIRVSFSTENLPESILKTFDEAVTCHSQSCFIAAAIMIRRTLEEICEERGAEGDNLRARVNDLRTKVLLPQALFEAMDELRLLGNDAAHIEAKTFAQITKQELDVALEFTIELLKALYQYSSTLST